MMLPGVGSSGIHGPHGTASTAVPPALQFLELQILTFLFQALCLYCRITVPLVRCAALRLDCGVVSINLIGMEPWCLPLIATARNRLAKSFAGHRAEASR